MFTLKKLLELPRKSIINISIILVLIYLSFGILFCIVYSLFLISKELYKQRKSTFLSGSHLIKRV